MARDSKRMALYEAIRKGQSKRQGGRKIAFFRPFGSSRARYGRRRRRDASLTRQMNGVASGYASRRRSPWLLRVRMMGWLRNIGVVAVASALIVFGVSRFLEARGDRGGLQQPVEMEQPGGGSTEQQPWAPEPVQRVDKEAADDGEDVENVPPPAVAKKPKEPAKTQAPQGTNLIVIQVYKARRDLEPVKEYFDRNGIETEIVQRGSYFFLVTKQLYQRCSADSTKFNEAYDGDRARKKIREIGAKYKAPPGYETFAAHLFSDAYGEKVR